MSTGKFNDRNYKDVGGLIGRGVSLDNASFSQCYNNGTITVSTKASGGHNVGGLVGWGYTVGKTITNCYSRATIKGSGGAVKGALLGYYSGEF